MPSKIFYRPLAYLAVLMVLTTCSGSCLPSTNAQFGGYPSTGFRPIGSPSPVDRFRPAPVVSSRPQSPDEVTANPAVTRTEYPSPTETGIVPVAFAQDGFSMPPMNDGSFNGNAPYAAPVTGSAAPPVTNPAARPTNNPSAAPPSQGAPLNRDPASLTRGASPSTLSPQHNLSQNGLQPVPSNSSSDLAPVPAPQMSGQWSTTGNSALVTGPSGYRAEFWDCGNPQVMRTSGSPYVYSPPTLMPNHPQSIAVTASPSGYRPLFSLGQENYNVQIGQGIIGQPTTYVPGQPFRNFLRYLSP